MVEVRGDALEWAIALAKAPAERVALRQRPLPGGMETLLQLATGVSATTLADAANRTGEAQADLLEAARFYIREILFYQGADAYRVLGLTRDADPGTIRSHYRLLQQWLHPDRHTSDWDAIFASRVNAAWNQLRTASSRAEYDARTPMDEHGERGGLSWMMPARLSTTPTGVAFADADQFHQDRWRRRVPVLALCAVCVVLGVVALRDMQRDPQDSLLVQAPVDDIATAPPASVALRVPTPAVRVTTTPVVKPVPRAPQIAAVAKYQAPAPAYAQVPVTTAAAKPVAPPVARAPAPKPVAMAVVAKPVATPVARVSAPKPVAMAVVAKPVATPVARAAVPKPVAKTAATPPVVIPVVKPTAIAAVAVLAKPAPPASRPLPAAASASVPLPAIPPTPPTPTMAEQALRSPANASAAQVGQAQRTGQQLIAYVTHRSTTVPPIWSSPDIQAQAVRMRASLQDENRVRGSEPHWRVGGDTAVMSTQLQAGDAQRQLRVALVWREQRWLVRSMALEQVP